MTRTLALLESPAQLVNLLERVHAPGGEAGDVRAAVILPRSPAARAQLRAVAGTARAEGLEVVEFAPRAGVRELVRCGLVLAARVRRAGTLVLGDPFSQLAQSLLPLAGAERVVVVDDGTATMEFAALLREGRPLVRWHSSGPVPGRARRATRLLAPGGARRVEVFTSLPVGEVPGVEVVRNGYGWTLSRFGPPVVTDTVDLLGTSLVETGVVAAEAYLGCVRDLVSGWGVSRYLAHRREDEAKLAVLAERTGVRVVRPELPLELHARIGPVARTVISFPSTTVHTLPLVLAGTGVRVVVQEVRAEWLSAGAGGHAARFLAEVTESARRRHGLASVPRVGA